MKALTVGTIFVILSLALSSVASACQCYDNSSGRYLGCTHNQNICTSLGGHCNGICTRHKRSRYVH
jgi:hypothetical protein